MAYDVWKRRPNKVETHGQNVLHGDYEDVVGDQEVPVVQDLFDGLQQQLATEEQEVEARHQVAHTENADPRRAGDEDDGEDEPEEVAKHDDLQHVQVGPGERTAVKQSVSAAFYIFFLHT